MNNEYCVMCGDEIPEGRQVCPSCEILIKGGDKNENMARKSLGARWRKFKAMRYFKKNRKRI